MYLGSIAIWEASFDTYAYLSTAMQDAKLKNHLLAVLWSLLPLNLELTVAYNEKRPQHFGTRTGTHSQKSVP